MRHSKYWARMLLSFDDIGIDVEQGWNALESLRRYFSDNHEATIVVGNINFMVRCFDTNWVVPMRPNVNAFEKDLEAFANGKSAGFGRDGLPA